MNGRTALVLAALTLGIAACEPRDDPNTAMRDTGAEPDTQTRPEYSSDRQPDSRDIATAPTAPSTPGMPGTPEAQSDTPSETAAGATVSFSGLDSNKDGKLDRDEAAGSAVLDRNFDTIDVNGDQSLSYEEFAAQRADR